MPVRDDLLDAAISVLGTQGRRELTHRAVDLRAGVPLGSTSNHFRTRKALVEGVVTRLAELDERDLAGVDAADTHSRDDLVAFTTRWLRAAAGSQRDRTMARYAMFLDAATDAQLRRPLRTARRRLLRRLERLLAPHTSDPTAAALVLADWVEGVVLHRVCLPQSGPFPRENQVAHVLDSVLGSTPIAPDTHRRPSRSVGAT